MEFNLFKKYTKEYKERQKETDKCVAEVEEAKILAKEMSKVAGFEVSELEAMHALPGYLDDLVKCYESCYETWQSLPKDVRAAIGSLWYWYDKSLELKKDKKEDHGVKFDRVYGFANYLGIEPEVKESWYKGSKLTIDDIMQLYKSQTGDVK
jgi:hypothetical protein